MAMDNTNRNKIRLRLEHGALLECPVWERHPRGRNWWAEIAIDPKAPGGLRRRFWERARGEYYYLVPQHLDLPTPVEVGADYYTGRGRKRPNRWYGVLTHVAHDSITLLECQSAREAIALSEQLRNPREPESRRVITVPATADHEGKEVVRA